MIREDCAQEDCIKGTCNIEQTCEQESEGETMSASKPTSAVMLYEPLSFLKPFNQEERTFTVAGHLIHIHQMWQEFGVAAVVWDAAIVLTEYLERQVSDGRLVMKDKRIIELGAGTGLVSMASAILGGNTTSTERSTLQILKKKLNKP
ncbi:hypothetical protein BSL78_03708 [Apostichopus japonicus]|uniref:Uncharacterized protein n=1 Tax=Stichopus japonicus TaxID=307972 RepID=A0A2G8LGN2_STIJA|nr:hypothetical protein BSL78_03708 [Apostichopus japonicus]